MENFLKYFMPLFLLAYLFIIFVLPSVRVYRQTGINPVTFAKKDNAHDYIGVVMKVLTGLLVVSIFLFSLSTKAYSFLNLFEYLAVDMLRYIGLFIIHAALVWIVVAQYNMKQSWRIGIDDKNKTALITNGLYSISRNPVFFGMIWSTVGIFFILPNAFTFLVAVTSYIIIHIQVRLEEEHLLKQHGSFYINYKNKVRRMI